MSSDVTQKRNLVMGDMAGGNIDKSITHIDTQIVVENNIAPASAPIRNGEIAIDNDNTVMIQKLKNGNFNATFIKSAIRRKIDTVAIVLDLYKLESGKNTVLDIYNNLMAVIESDYLSQLNEGDELRTQLKDIKASLSPLVLKYKGLVEIDEAFLMGLLYIATSSCALRWRMEPYE